MMHAAEHHRRLFGATGTQDCDAIQQPSRSDGSHGIEQKGPEAVIGDVRTFATAMMTRLGLA
jgi:hypothetical protein